MRLTAAIVTSVTITRGRYFFIIVMVPLLASHDVNGAGVSRRAAFKFNGSLYPC